MAGRRVHLVVACDGCIRAGRECTGLRPACRLCKAHGHTCSYEGLSPDNAPLAPTPEPGLEPVIKLADITGFASSGDDVDFISGERRALQLLKNADHVRLHCQSVGFQIVPSEVLLIATPMYDSVEGYKSLQRITPGQTPRQQPRRLMSAAGRYKARAIDPSLDQMSSLSAQVGISSQRTARDVEHSISLQNAVRKSIRVRFHTSSYGTRKARKLWHTQRTTESLYTVSVPLGDDVYDRRIPQATVQQWNIQYTSDEEFRAILHSFFCWDFPSNRLFEEEPLLEGLAGGPSENCTALLMHSIIAFASKNYSITEPGNARAIEQDALSEAGRIWGSNERSNNCSDAAAGILLFMVTSANGAEEPVRYILERALNILRDLETDQVSPQSNQLSVAAWASYAFQTFAMLGTHEPPLQIDPPSVPAPLEQKDVNLSDWSPDRSSIPPKPGMISSIASARAKLAIIASGITRMHQDLAGERQRHAVAATDLLNRLTAWRSALKFPLQCLTPASPHLLLLHAQYHQAVIEVCGPLLNSYDFNDPRFGNAAMQSMSTLHAIAFSYDRQYPDAPIPIGFVAPLLHAAHGAGQALGGNGPTIPDAQFFLRLCTALLARMATAFPVVLQHMTELRRMGVELPRAQDTVA